jgi:hypothetical protein
VVKEKADGSGFEYAGCIGGDSTENGYGIAVNESSHAFVTGDTASDQTTFPVLVGPDLTYNLGSSDVFVTEIKADGTGYVYSGYIGGFGTDVGYSIAVDDTGKAYITGSTQSYELVFRPCGPDISYNGVREIYL